MPNPIASLPSLAPRGSGLPGFLTPPSQTPAPTAYARDAWTPAAAPSALGAAPSGGGLIGWLVGAAVAGFWALPKLARFGPAGLLTSALVVLAGGWYGGRVVGAGQAVVAGDVRPAAQVGLWFLGGRLAAAAIATWRLPGAFVAAALIWAGSWGAGKLLDLVWKR